MKELFVCDTPYQLFNALNIVYNTATTRKGNSERDLYVINQFRSAQKIVENIQKTGLFDHIYLLRKDDTKFLSVGMKRNIRMSIDFLRPKLFLKKRLSDYKYDSIVFDDYHRIYGSGAYSTVAAVLKVNPQAEFILFEDGLGTYSEPTVEDIIDKSSGGKLNRLFCRVFHVGSYICRPSKLLVNNIKACRCAKNKIDNVLPLPQISDEFLTLCYKVFETKGIDDDRWYWLSQPIDCNPGAPELRDIVRDVMLDYKNHICVRIHPRDLDEEYYSQFQVDRGTDLWELSVLNKDPDKLVLIGSFSAAQVTPKLLFDIEPVLLFLYSFNSSLSYDEKKAIREEIQSVRRMYKHPERVVEIKSIGELRRKMDSLISSS